MDSVTQFEFPKKKQIFFLCCFLLWNQIPDKTTKSPKKRMRKNSDLWYLIFHIWFFTWLTYFLFFFSYINQSINRSIVEFDLFRLFCLMINTFFFFLVHYLCNAAASAVVVWPIKLNPSIHPVSIIIKGKKCSKRHTQKSSQVTQIQNPVKQKKNLLRFLLFV